MRIITWARARLTRTRHADMACGQLKLFGTVLLGDGGEMSAAIAEGGGRPGREWDWPVGVVLDGASALPWAAEHCARGHAPWPAP